MKRLFAFATVLLLAAPAWGDCDDGHALFDLGKQYYFGSGVEQDYAEAAKWYRLAAEQGNAEAQLALEAMFEEFLPLAEQGHADAQLALEALELMVTPVAPAEDLAQLMDTGDCRQCNFSSADLSGANLSGANLSGANLSDASLSGANLSDADLSGANLRGADLSGANLSRANLSCADLWGANFNGAALSSADFSGANLSGSIINFGEGLSASAAKAVHSALMHRLMDSYSAYLDAHLPYEYPNFQPSFTTALKSAEIDIGIGEQVPAVFIWLELTGYCGSGGCDTVGLINIDDTWKIVFEDFGSCAYRLLDTGTNGIRDIIAIGCKTASNYPNRLFQFHGQTYNR